MHEMLPNHSDFKAVKQESVEIVSWITKVTDLAQQRLCGLVSIPGTDFSLRSLYTSEVDTLISRGCRSADWSEIRILTSTKQHQLDQSPRLASHLSRSNFQGTVVLWIEDSSTPNCISLYNHLPRGIHDNLLVTDSVLHLDAWVYRNACLSNTVVAKHAALIQNGNIECSTPFGDHLTISVGPEAGGSRNVHVTTVSTMIDVCQQLLPQKNLSSSKPETSIKNVYNKNFILSDTVIRDTPTISGVFLFPRATIQAASKVSATVLLQDATIQNGSSVEQCLLQWNASITSNSDVGHTLLMEHCVVGPHSTTHSTILGPDVHLSNGEVHASILGPNTNAHHQSLLISVLWPLGRGNVGYGANVGSNHTGRIPDQETVAGEGIFWGLSSVIKFPVNLLSAPYSVVAAGTTLQPQRVTLPFSLLVDGQILPGWVLESSPYTIARSERKFQQRRKAKRHEYYTGWKIFRIETVELCVQARYALESCQGKLNYSNKDLSAVGHNSLSEKARVKGIQAYSECIQRFALRGLLEFCRNQIQEGSQPIKDVLAKEFETQSSLPSSLNNHAWVFPWQYSQQDQWNYQKILLLREFPVEGDMMSWLSHVLDRLMQLEEAFTKRIYACKQRDDVRGSELIPDYTESHVLADHDPVIRQASIDMENIKTTVQLTLTSSKL